MTSSIAELRAELQTAARQLKRLFDDAGPEPAFDADQRTTIANLVAATKAKRDELAAIDEAQRIVREHADGSRPALGGLVLPGQGGIAPQYKTFRQQVDENDYLAECRAKGQRPPSGTILGRYSHAEYKTLITLANINVAPERRAAIQPMALETTKVDDLFGRADTINNTIQYYEETTVTNAAATVAEGALKPESALGYTLRTENVRKIATWIPATDELLADVPFMESTIRDRLLFMIDRIRQVQLVSGDGTGTNLLGVINRVGVQTLSGATGSITDNLLNAVVLVQSVGFAEPSGIVMHPHDFGTLRKLQTTAGGYIFAPPTSYPDFTVWGLPVRTTTGIAQGTALVGDFRASAQVVDREAPVVSVSTEHQDFFIRNQIAILAEERLALLVFRPQAFCTVTAIPA